MSDMIKIAAAQINPKFMDVKSNLGLILDVINEAAKNKTHLIAFPECILAGYMFQNREEALRFAEPVPGPSTEKVSSLCQKLDVYSIYGLLEKDNDRLFNTAAFVGPQGVIGKYRKNHLPFLGTDRFIDKGDTFYVFQTPIGNIGLQICYDIEFPESSRVMALMGAELLVHISAAPITETDIRIINHVVISRAIENTVNVVTANRVGNERGLTACGMSKIVNTSGEIISCASPDKEEIIYGEISIEKAQQKHTIFTPGEYEQDYMADRRPELYDLITRSTSS
jgi:predicted amidohydrolase